jgi:hypothetical protein
MLKNTIRAKNPAQTVEEQTNLVVSAPLSFIEKLQDITVTFILIINFKFYTDKVIKQQSY